VPDIFARVEFLKKLHLFRGLSDEQLKSIADELQEQPYSEPDTVFMQGAPADALYIIHQGRVTLTRRVAGKQAKIGTLVRGDYFGEQGLITGRTRSATVQAEKGTLLFILRRDSFRNLLRKVPGLRSNFKIMIASRELARQLRFKWLADNEIIYLITRKHPILLIRSLFVPVAAMLPILGVLALAFAWLSTTLAAIGAFAFVLDLAWGLWSYVDWGNDYYIVTNQRVIWMEKVIALYDSRTEANMSTILSVSMETDQVGRIFDYGTVVVRTFTGQIRMVYMPSPKQAAAMIEEYWMRSKDGNRQAEQEGIKQAIRNKLGLAPPKAPAPPPAAPRPEKKSIQLRDLWQDAFKMRVEEGGIVTYRKHVYVLFRDTWIQNIVFLFLFAAPFLWGMYFAALPPLWFFAVLVLALMIDTVMWAYEYLDWSNDIYQVTAEQIIDINRKPFGTEDRKAAPLENILSSEYKRTGFIGMLLNFGTVYIMVGGAQFNFEDVADPPVVQQDIVRRQQTRLYKKREAETAGERERLADWLAMYHRTVEEIQREENPSEPKNSE
jgi:CRP-like cAMP-binding protein